MIVHRGDGMRQLVTPIIPYRVDFGQCLKQVRTAFGAPVRGPSATSEANRTEIRHYGRTMPDVAVPVWFDHWGTYGWPARYDNWGHVVVWVPGRGFLSSPKRGTNSFHWYGSIEAIERAIGAKYRFWSEDINGIRVAEPRPEPIPAIDIEEDDDMKPTVHFRTTNGDEWSRVHPDIGRDLKAGQSRKDGRVTVYRGFEATADRATGVAWARTHAAGAGGETSRTNRADYIAIQAQATRLSIHMYG